MRRSTAWSAPPASAPRCPALYSCQPFGPQPRHTPWPVRNPFLPCGREYGRGVSRPQYEAEASHRHQILPSCLGADSDRLSRLQGEAEVLTSLNHPHRRALRPRRTEGEASYFSCLRVHLKPSRCCARRPRRLRHVLRSRTTYMSAPHTTPHGWVRTLRRRREEMDNA
jgi:hypothetical protein